MNDNREASTAALALRVTEMRQQYAAEVYHQLKGWVGRDASREVAALALATWSRRHAVDEQTASRVLSWFEPKPVEVDGEDWLDPAREEVPLCQRFPSADELRPYMGRWVAVVAGKVIWSTETLSALLGHLERESITAHSTFLVPAEASVDADQAEVA